MIEPETTTPPPIPKVLQCKPTIQKEGIRLMDLWKQPMHQGMTYYRGCFILDLVQKSNQYVKMDFVTRLPTNKRKLKAGYIFYI